MSTYCTSEHIDFLVKHGYYPDDYYKLNNIPIPKSENRILKQQKK